MNQSVRCNKDDKPKDRAGNEPHGLFPGNKVRKPQYVLGTKNGTERTSNVNEEKIRDEIDAIDDNGCVYLEKCVPRILVRHAEAYSIDYFKDSSIAVCFRVSGCMVRMWRPDVDCDMAADMMCGFFRNASLPDMTGWHCQKVYPEQEKEAVDNLIVNDQDFRYFGCADVVGALENIIEGKSRSMLYIFTKDNGGYVKIHRCGKDASTAQTYKVEYVRWTEGTPVGYRGEMSDFRPLRSWLWDMIDSDILPGAITGWRIFSVNGYFENMVLRFLDEEKDER